MYIYLHTYIQGGACDTSRPHTRTYTQLSQCSILPLSPTSKFPLQFYRKPAIHNYRQYIVNFPAAMDVLAKGVHKKLKFVNFLKQQLKSDVSRLSLQALLLKPVQRFPQYLLFLQVSSDL